MYYCYLCLIAVVFVFYTIYVAYVWQNKISFSSALVHYYYNVKTVPTSRKSTCIYAAWRLSRVVFNSHASGTPLLTNQTLFTV